VLGVFPLQEINCGCTGQRGKSAYKEWIDLAFPYKVLHVTPMRVEARDEANKKMQEFRNHMKPEEEISTLHEKKENE